MWRGGQRPPVIATDTAQSVPTSPEVDPITGPACVIDARATAPVALEGARSIDEADAAFARQDWPAFEAHLREAARHDVPQGHYNLAVLEQNRGEHAEAAAHLVRTLELDPCYHAARLELARMYVEGWGVARDPSRGAALFARVVDESPEPVSSVARTNLAILHLYGLGVPRSLETARALLLAASEHSADARALLAQLPPTDEPWRERALEPLQAIAPIAVRRVDGRWDRPAWVPAQIRPWVGRWDAVAAVQNYVASRTIAIGLPGDDRRNQPAGSERFDECLEIGPDGPQGAQIRFVTMHTNRNACAWNGHIAAVESAGGIVAFDDSFTPIVDPATGVTESLQGCIARVRVELTGAEIVEDWPPGCLSMRCRGLRGDPRGRRLPPAADGRTCEDVASETANRMLPEQIGERPPWANEAEGGRGAARLRAYRGTWEHAHGMPSFAGDDPDGNARWDEAPVVDRMTVCPRPDGAHEFTFMNSTINDHACELRGVASVNAAGDLLLIGEGPSGTWIDAVGVIVPGPPCVLRATVVDGVLAVRDEWPSGCADVDCGARAHPSDATFPAASHRGIASCR